MQFFSATKTCPIDKFLVRYCFRLISSGGVLEDTFWSPWPWSLKSSKIALSSARGQQYFFNRWNFVGNCQKPRRKFAKNFFCFPQVKIAWKIIFEDLFLRMLEKIFWKPFFWRILVPVSLASKFFCVFGLEPCVLDSTSVNQISLFICYSNWLDKLSSDARPILE